MNEFDDRILAFAMSSHHSVPIAIIAGKKSIVCVSLSNVKHRYLFYSMLESDYRRNMTLDIHDDEPLAVIGIERQIKLFDLCNGRCNILSNDYSSLPASVERIRANQCPTNEFLVAYDNYQISVFDRRQKQGGIQHFYGHHSSITTMQMDSWKIASTDEHGCIRLW
jgi:hypothetical protein